MSYDVGTQDGLSAKTACLRGSVWRYFQRPKDPKSFKMVTFLVLHKKNILNLPAILKQMCPNYHIFKDIFVVAVVFYFADDNNLSF